MYSLVIMAALTSGSDVPAGLFGGKGHAGHPIHRHHQRGFNGCIAGMGCQGCVCHGGFGGGCFCQGACFCQAAPAPVFCPPPVAPAPEPVRPAPASITNIIRINEGGTMGGTGTATSGGGTGTATGGGGTGGGA